MFLWFIGTAVITVWYVFRDPRFDYRLLIVGALLPELDALAGGMRWMHSLAFSVALLIVVMVVSVGHKSRRKLLLGLPIGTFLHLVFDGGVGDHGGVLVAVHRELDRRRAIAVGATRMVERAAGDRSACSSSCGSGDRPDCPTASRRRAVLRTGRLFDPGPVIH